MEFRIPLPLVLEHEELHVELAKATKAAGRIGSAAQAVAKLLHPHFVKEEAVALPPLGLLSALAEGKITPEMRDALAMTDRLQAELAEMLEEHKAIVGALQELAAAAKQERKREYERFAEKLVLHTQTEEQVLYPTALLIGEYLKTKLGS
ncbi:MAG: hemerythrin domain-containing protein [Candidatus Binatia bacterium]